MAKGYVATDVTPLVSFTCGKCKEKHLVEVADISTFGGCSGGHYDEDRCYCSSSEVRASMKGPRCEIYFDVLLKEGF